MSRKTTSANNPLFAMGAWNVQAMLLEIERCNKTAVAAKRERDLPAIRKILDDCLSGGDEYHEGCMMALAELLGIYMDGSCLADPRKWRPLGLAKPRSAS